MQISAHLLFDYASYLSAIFIAVLSKNWVTKTQPFPISDNHAPYYFIVVWVGALSGAFVIGTLNTSLSDYPMYGKSVVGALLGGIITAELFKAYVGVHVSTGLIFVMPLAFGIGLGRIGCFYGGLEDFTYGIPANVAWAYDFGDGILRHPVQLYESASMFLFLILFGASFGKERLWVTKNAFYLFIAYYAIQRFTWEFYKPYATIFGSLNIFHFVCIVLFIYSIFAMRLSRRNG